MDNWKNRQSEHLRVNKMGKNVRKTPLQQPISGGSASRLQPHAPPQVYNISKNEFRHRVQQLTGLASQEPPTRHRQKPQSMRLQSHRPPPLLPIKRPPTQPPIPKSTFDGSFAQFPALTPAESPITGHMQYVQSTPIQGQNPTKLPPSKLPPPTCHFLLPSPSFLVSHFLSPGTGFSPTLSPIFSVPPSPNPPPSTGLFPFWP